MENIQKQTQLQMRRVLKSNLWKFFKTLRVQANPIFCLLVASPINYAWITIIDKTDSASQKRISIGQFVNYLKKMPSANKHYQLGINLYSTDNHTTTHYEALWLHELSVDKIISLAGSIVAYHCSEAIKCGEPLKLTPQIIKHYKFKARYLDELNLLIEQCNAALEKETNSHL